MTNQKSLKEHIEDFLEFCEVGKNLSERTLRNYRHWLFRFSEFFQEHRKAEEISLQDIQKFRLILNRKKDRFGNPIGIIQGYIDLLRQDSLSLEERQQFSQRALTELERINDLIRQPLDFAGTSSGDFEKIQINEDFLDVWNNKLMFGTGFSYSF